MWKEYQKSGVKSFLFPDEKPWAQEGMKDERGLIPNNEEALPLLKCLWLYNKPPQGTLRA